MNQFKKAQVLLLPTEKASQLCIYNKELYYVIDGEFNLNRDKYNIYITSDDEIKLGNWSYNIANKTIFQADSQFVKLINQKEVTTNKKIIATTDTSLNNCAVMYCSEKCIDYCVYKNDLPQPSQQFIEKYIESYNKGEVITDVLVEYEYVDCLYSVEKTTHKRILKVNDKDNTINIKSIKDSWNREEVIEKMWLSYKASNTIFEDEIALKMEFNNWLTL